MNILVVIPSIDDDNGILQKNVRILEGQPLMSYPIEMAQKSQFQLDICVSTNDDAIARVARRFNARVVERDESLNSNDVTLDPVVYHAWQVMSSRLEKNYDLVVTLQATSPLMTADLLDEAIERIMQDESIDTLVSVTNQPRLAWVENAQGEIVPVYNERRNRRQMPNYYLETGAFVITRASAMTPGSRFGEHVAVHEIPASKAVEIVSPQDWWVAETELSKKNILIRVEGFAKMGLGHVYRGMALANSLIHHNVHFIMSSKSDLAITKLADSGYTYTVVDSVEDIAQLNKDFHADIIINDFLNTTLEYMIELKKIGARIINFEDLGPGSELADAVVNELYGPLKKGDHYYWGSDYYILRDEFLVSEPSQYHEKVTNILVVFGGVDPSNLTQKIFDSIPYIIDKDKIQFTFIAGPGYEHLDKIKTAIADQPYQIQVMQNVQNISSFMKTADIAVSSQGRTMLELASMGVPTVIMAQNRRELMHEFGYISNGFINLGLGSDLSPETIGQTLNWLIDTPQVREQMHQQMLGKDLRNGLNRVLKIIFDHVPDKN